MNTRALCLFAFPATLLALVAACTATPTGSGDTQPSPDGGAGGDSGGGVVVAKPGQLALSVQKARRGGSAGKKGLVELAVTLSNGEGGVNALSNPALFKLKGSDGLAVSGGAMPASYIQGTACNPAGEVTAGAAYSCVLTFQLADNAEAVELSYVNPADKRSPKAAVSVEACTACGAKCTYLDADKGNCGQCGLAQTSSSEWDCNAGVAKCPQVGWTACGDSCVDLKKSAKHCGRCGNAVPSSDMICKDGAPACLNSQKSVCGVGSCVDLATDTENCGSCGKSCSHSGLSGLSCLTKTGETSWCYSVTPVANEAACTAAFCTAKNAAYEAYLGMLDGTSWFCVCYAEPR